MPAFSWRCLLVLAIAVLSALPAHAETLSYGPNPAQLLDVCRPAGAGAGRPALVMIHGGGWHQGSKGLQKDECAAMARSGIVAFAIDYRLADGMRDTAWPAQIEDAQLAMRWVRTHAADYGLDAANVCAEGESAGGHLAMMLGALSQAVPGDMQRQLATVSPRADCVISLSGPSDLVKFAQTRPRMVDNLFGHVATAEDRRRQEVSASPALLAGNKPGMPTLLIHGTADGLVPFDQGLEMFAALQKAGTSAWLVVNPGGHMLQGVAPGEVRALLAEYPRFVKTHRLPGRSRQLDLKDLAENAP